MSSQHKQATLQHFFRTIPNIDCDQLEATYSGQKHTIGTGEGLSRHEAQVVYGEISCLPLTALNAELMREQGDDNQIDNDSEVPPEEMPLEPEDWENEMVDNFVTIVCL